MSVQKECLSCGGLGDCEQCSGDGCGHCGNGCCMVCGGSGLAQVMDAEEEQA